MEKTNTLPIDFVIDSFKEFRDWFNSNGCPREINCTPLQYCQYEDLLGRDGHIREANGSATLLFQGVALMRNGTNNS